jgi:hypothetical protein
MGVTFAHRAGRWHYAAGESDNSTTADPFSRPEAATNSVHGWCDWHCNGGANGWGDDDPPPWRHTFFGIAPVGTARLTVTDEAGRTRDLQITPWNGAYVAIVAGAHSTLTGYDDAGNRLGSFKPMDGFTKPEDDPAPPGYERVEWPIGGAAEPILFRRVVRSQDE